jgi:hypothetical protein
MKTVNPRLLLSGRKAKVLSFGGGRGGGTVGCFRSVTRNSLTRNKWRWFVDLYHYRDMYSIVIRLAFCLACRNEIARHGS